MNLFYRASHFTRAIFFKTITQLGLFVSLCYANVVYAANSGSGSGLNIPTLSDALTNLSLNIPAVMQMVTAFAYIAGLFFVVEGIIELRRVGESRTMMSQEHGFKKPLVRLIIGGFLIYLPSAVQTGIATLWEVPYPTAYIANAGSASAWQVVINNSFTILQLIGVIAFIRGLIILAQIGGHGQPVFWRGMTHIIGGILCINMYDTVTMVENTLGLGGLFSSIS